MLLASDNDPARAAAQRQGRLAGQPRNCIRLIVVVGAEENRSALGGQ